MVKYIHRECFRCLWYHFFIYKAVRKYAVELNIQREIVERKYEEEKKWAERNIQQESTGKK